MVELFDSVIASVGPLALVVLGIAAMLEYVVPPFPGDSIMLLGGVYAVRGQHPWPWVFAAVTAGSVAGAAINYALGAWLARRYDERPEARHVFGLTPGRLAGMQARMRRHGAWLVLVNRFLPGIRGLLFVAAGAAKLPRGRVLGLGAVSAMAHSGLVLAVGMMVGGNLEELERWFARYQRLVVALIGVAALAFLVRHLARRRVNGRTT